MEGQKTQELLIPVRKYEITLKNLPLMGKGSKNLLQVLCVAHNNLLKDVYKSSCLGFQVCCI